MLSRVIIIGKAPKELVDILGYNPVISLDRENFANQIKDILEHVEDYQDLVDKNREMALKLGDWKERAKAIKGELLNKGYKL